MKEEIYNYIVEQINSKIEQKKAPFAISDVSICNHFNHRKDFIKSYLNELFKENRIKVYNSMNFKFI